MSQRPRSFWAMMRLLCLVALHMLIAAMSTASSASAGTATMNVTREEEGDEADVVVVQHDSATYVAAPGELNDIVVTVVADAVVFADRGAAVTAGDGCQSVDANTARCPIVPLKPARRGCCPRVHQELSVVAIARAGDGADRLRVGAPPQLTRGSATVNLSGGPGNDQLFGAEPSSGSIKLSGDDGIDTLGGGGANEDLRGGPGTDLLEAGGGDDTLSGGDGADNLRGGNGDDSLDGEQEEPYGAASPLPSGGFEADELDGGPGRDTTGYRFRRADVVLDLSDPGTDGSVGEGDRLISIEDVSGTESGGNRLIGDGGPNRLYGSESRREQDTLLGGGGNDRLDGSDGPNELQGGGGDDVISDPTPPKSSCGGGRDMVVNENQISIVANDCERLRSTETDIELTHPVIRAGAMRARILDGPRRKRLLVGLRSRGGGLLARGVVRLNRRSRGSLRARLTQHGRRVYRRTGRLSGRLNLVYSLRTRVVSQRGTRRVRETYADTFLTTVTRR